MADHNLEKFTSKNPLQQYFIEKFYTALVGEIRSIEKKNSILDAGCGEGFTTRRLQKEFSSLQFTGIDQDEEAIDYAIKNDSHARYSRGDVTKIPFDDSSFDLVLCNEVLEHLPHPELAITELLRVTKKYLLISVPHEPFFRISNLIRGRNILRFGNYPYHLNTWSKKQITRLLSHYCVVEKAQTPFPWTLLTCRKKS